MCTLVPTKEISNIKHRLERLNGHTTLAYILCQNIQRHHVQAWKTQRHLNSLSASYTYQATKKENIITKMTMNVEVFNSSIEGNGLETKLRRNCIRSRFWLYILLPKSKE